MLIYIDTDKCLPYSLVEGSQASSLYGQPLCCASTQFHPVAARSRSVHLPKWNPTSTQILNAGANWDLSRHVTSEYWPRSRTASSSSPPFKSSKMRYTCVPSVKNSWKKIPRTQDYSRGSLDILCREVSPARRQCSCAPGYTEFRSPGRYPLYYSLSLKQSFRFEVGSWFCRHTAQNWSCALRLVQLQNHPSQWCSPNGKHPLPTSRICPWHSKNECKLRIIRAQTDTHLAIEAMLGVGLYTGLNRPNISFIQAFRFTWRNRE